MAAGERGVPGATVLARVAEGCSILSGPVTTLCPRTGASTARARGSSTAPVTQRSAPTPTVRDVHCGCARWYRWTRSRPDLSVSLSQACRTGRNSAWPTTICRPKCRWVRATASSGCPSTLGCHPKTAVSWCAGPRGRDTSLSSNLR